MKRWLLLVLTAFFYGVQLHAETETFEQPPYDVKDPEINENFRNAYLAIDRLGLLGRLVTYTFNSSSNTFCLDSPTFCVDAINHRVDATTIVGSSITSAAGSFTTIIGSSITSTSGSFTTLTANTATANNATITASITAASITVSTLTTTSSFTAVNGMLIKTVAGSTLLNLPSSGELRLPLQPSFLVTMSGDALNVTGDGTTYTVAFNSEIYDQGGDFSSNTFTAPITGRYCFTILLTNGQIGAATSDELDLVTSNNTYIWGRFASMSNTIGQPQCGDMDANDTATVTYKASGTTKTVDVQGGGTNSVFSGFLAN